MKVTCSPFTWRAAHEFLPFCDSKRKQQIKTVLSISGEKKISHLIFFLTIHGKGTILCTFERQSLVRGSASCKGWWEVSQLLSETGKWELDLLIFFLKQVHLLTPEHLLQALCLSALFSSTESSHKRGRNLGLDLRSVNTVILFAYGSLVAVVEEKEALEAYEDKSGEINTKISKENRPSIRKN